MHDATPSADGPAHFCRSMRRQQGEASMPQLLTPACPLSCSFGLTPSVFIATEMPGKPVVNEAFAAATIVEIIPIENVPPFGMCSSEANPEVIAATAAALGALTPMPCVPVIVAPWAPPSA